MEQSGMRDSSAVQVPDFALLHPGYGLHYRDCRIKSGHDECGFVIAMPTSRRFAAAQQFMVSSLPETKTGWLLRLLSAVKADRSEPIAWSFKPRPTGIFDLFGDKPGRIR
jgi:hypothetical protein